METTAKCRDTGRIQECTQLEPLTTGLKGTVNTAYSRRKPEQLHTLRAT